MNEFELIASLTEGWPQRAAGLVKGVGDDCAIISGGRDHDWLVTTDALIEGIHFRREWTDFKTLGRKALSVNLSDIAAMGGIPRFYLVAIGLAPGDAAGTAHHIYDGMHEVASEHSAVLIGGDTSASPSGIFLSITAIGEVERGRALLRSGARAGDTIYVTGTFGSSALGLCCLKSNFTDEGSGEFIRRHLDPSPRLKAGQWIASSRMASAMIDASDGLVADLGHIAYESGVGFEIDAGRVPRDEGFEDAAKRIGEDPILLALTGGEDYELVFAIKVSRDLEFQKLVAARAGGTKITRIGTIIADRSVRHIMGLHGKALDIPAGGFDHFEKRVAK